MSVVDFTQWVIPDLPILLGGKTYSAHPPSVDQAKIIVAFMALAEIKLGLAKGPADPDLVALADAQTDTLAVITLGQAVYDQMVADGVDEVTIDRVGFYGMLFWTQGKERADWVAEQMWSPKDSEESEPSPKARRRSKSGPSTASANRTRTASTRTTGSHKT